MTFPRFLLQHFLSSAIVLTLLLIASSLPAAEEVVVLPPDVVRIDANDLLPLELVSQKVSRDGKELTIVVKAENRSFYLGLDFTGTEYKTAVIVVKDAKKWRAIEYFASKRVSGMSVDLLHLKGVSIALADGDCTMTFNANGYKILPPGGMLRYTALPKDEQ